jgi:uncharacterized protein YqhQ
MCCDCGQEFEVIKTWEAVDPVTFEDVRESIIVCSNCGCELGPV